jgi:hypothetical protein
MGRRESGFRLGKIGDQKNVAVVTEAVYFSPCDEGGSFGKDVKDQFFLRPGLL